MRIVHYTLNSRLENDLEPLVAAIGFFDGLHNGHQQLVKETLKQAKIKGLVPALITFSPSPESVVSNQPEQLLSTVEERAKIAKQLGVKVLIIIRFNKDLSQLHTDAFYNQVIKKLNVKHLVGGEDFRYGYRGEGNIETLKKIKGLGLSVIKDYKYLGERVSSTRIKKMLEDGDLESVLAVSSHPYELNGFVMHGKKVGRTIGFPTLNLLIDDVKIIPRDGVYVGITVIGNKNYISTINIGHNPTINTVIKKSIESYVHDYNEDTYGQEVTIKLLKRLRNEEKFDSVEALIEQMHIDIEDSQEYFDSKLRRLYNIESI